MSEVQALLQPLKDRLAAAMNEPENGRAQLAFTVRGTTDQAKLIAAIEAVAGLHKPDAGHNPLCDCGIPAGAAESCEECQDAWPCPTVAALTKALGDG